MQGFQAMARMECVPGSSGKGQDVFEHIQQKQQQLELLTEKLILLPHVCMAQYTFKFLEEKWAYAIFMTNLAIMNRL